jgi:hypothetical protein
VGLNSLKSLNLTNVYPNNNNKKNNKKKNNKVKSKPLELRSRVKKIVVDPKMKHNFFKFIFNIHLKKKHFRRFILFFASTIFLPFYFIKKIRFFGHFTNVQKCGHMGGFDFGSMMQIIRLLLDIQRSSHLHLTKKGWVCSKIINTRSPLSKACDNFKIET